MTFTPILATTSHYVLHSPPQGVFLPVDPASVSSSASEAAAATAHCEASLATQRQTLIAAYARCKKRGDRAGAKAVWEKLHKVTNQMLGAV